MMKVSRILSLLLLFFAWHSFADAAVVYLKNGKIMTGRIVEKNEQYLVLKTGEGESAVRTTIFSEDYSRIESEETLFKENAFIPFELFRQQELGAPLSPPETTVQYNATRSDNDQQEYIRKLLEESRGSGADASVGKTQKKFLAVLPQAVSSGQSSIVGTVRLPELAGKTKGDLHIFLMKENSDGDFFASPQFPYRKIAGNAVLSNLVDYNFENLPEGRYRVLAQWDIAKPYIEIKKVENQTIFRRLASKGDYTGTSEVVSLGSDEHRFKVDFDCVTFLKESQVVVSSFARQPYEITDIIYNRLGRNTEKFTMYIKNVGEVPTRYFELKVKINGEALGPGTVRVQPLKPDEETAIDLTSSYQDYRKLMLDRDPEQPLPKELRFVITEEHKDEAEFEKTIAIF